MIEIDLHGYTHEEAVMTVERILINESLKGYIDVNIITGNSQKLQDKLIEEVLEPHGFSFNIPSWNMGTIFVNGVIL